MSHHIFKEVLHDLCAKKGFRDEVKGGKKDLHEFGLNENEIFVLFQCGVYCGHLDPTTGKKQTPDANDKDQKRFRKVLSDLSAKNKTYRTKVKVGAINLEKDEGLTVPQINVLYEAGVCCGHL